MHKFEEITVKSETIFKGKMISLQVDEVQLPNGKYSKREMIKHPGAVAILAITDDKKIVLVEQYRKPANQALIEIPAGKLEPGEKPELTAVRELEEETGYRCEKLEFITSFYTAPGFADEILHIYKATGLKKLEEPKTADEDEFVELMEVTLEKAVQLVTENKICDAKTTFAIQYAQLQEVLNAK
ncbi:NUDIX hydrolase [Heyndrickxia acidicola]|uniref:NUDIX hydrolase n=1 Tax=Heyndrickxia acidicola TaxID=209389 RepID=A0ABU6MJU2_9BACI|nr:NUDIX hydrolase [Heyndrickxia acidicola]MED1204949.1 NUDIX hydrolase [Heyndrickxia acidicola]